MRTNVTEQTWIYVPEQSGEGDDEGHEWAGRIWPEGDQMLRWQFEVIRLARGAAVYDQGVFQNAAPVSALIDHQRPATLLRPIVFKVDPGKAGSTHPFLRTKLSGSFQALLTGKAVADEKEPLFVGMGVESQTFAAWYGGRSFKEEVDENYRPTSIELAQLDEQKVTIPGLGEAVAVRSPSVQRGHASSEVRTRTVLRITFDEPKSLSDALELCVGIELVFGFLAGYRPKPPVFHLWWKGEDTDVVTPRDAQLEIGGIQYRSGNMPHPFERLHMNRRDSAGLSKILQTFADNRKDLPTRIAAIQTGRWFGGTVNGRFAAVMPMLEEYLKAHFQDDEEASYIALEQAFFAHVDASDNPDIREFSRKHIEVKKRKSPSLPTLISRAIDRLNTGGFAFDSDLARRIAKRRATMFHSSPTMVDADIQAFHEEAKAATAILLLLTLADLGVELGPLSTHYHGLIDFSQFMKRREPVNWDEALSETVDISSLSDVPTDS